MSEIKFEDAFQKLEKLMEEMEKGDLPLDQQLKRYEEGVKLIRLLSEKLEKAKKKVSKLTQKEDGTFTLENGDSDHLS